PRTLVRENSPSLRLEQTDALLQWGRALSCAEIPGSIAPKWYGVPMLQWGRALSCAEMLDHQHIPVRDRQASMGPRTLVRGNIRYTRRSKTKATRLQWGRALSCAEIPMSETFIKKGIPASMGPRTLVRGNIYSGVGLHSCGHASMGPRTLVRGNKESSIS